MRSLIILGCSLTFLTCLVASETDKKSESEQGQTNKKTDSFRSSLIFNYKHLSSLLAKHNITLQPQAMALLYSKIVEMKIEAIKQQQQQHQPNPIPNRLLMIEKILAKHGSQAFEIEEGGKCSVMTPGRLTRAIREAKISLSAEKITFVIEQIEKENKSNEVKA